MSPVRYPILFLAPILISMSFDHNLKLVSFRIMVDVNAELSVDGVIEVSSMLLCFGFCGIWGFCV